MRIKNKSGLIDYINDHKFEMVVEIGCGTGDFAKRVLENTKATYCGIDLWEKWDKDKHDDQFHYQDNNGDKCYEQWHDTIAPLNTDKRSAVSINTSSRDSKVLSCFEDGSIDILILDGDITEDGLLADLKLWLPKVKLDGLVFGFRYGEDVDTGMLKNTKKSRYRKIAKCNVKKVMEFYCSERGFELQTTTRGKEKHWFFVHRPVVNRIQKDKIDLEICIHTHRYQRRLSWMLSSILQQEGDVPNIIVTVSHSENDGDPTTREVLDFFRDKGMVIRQFVLSDKEIPNRAIGRNLQVKHTVCDWMLFADSDMVYDPHFFEDLQRQIKGDFAFETRCIGADRVSLDIPFCIKHFEEDDRDYPCVIPDVADLCAKWPVKWTRGSGTAPGNFQLANTQAIMMRGGVYSHREGDVWRATKADRHFRCNMGGRCPMKVLPQYHLNHDRGGPEIQR